jgi:hypothetical protein
MRTLQLTVNCQQLTVSQQSTVNSQQLTKISGTAASKANRHLSRVCFDPVLT